jgi:hypothetical protein
MTSDGTAEPDERMRITSSGNVGIGTSTPGAKLHIADDASAYEVLDTHHSSAGARSVLFMDRGRGTAAAPAPVLAGDELYRIWGRAINAGAAQNATIIGSVVDAAPGVSWVPAALYFMTSDGTGEPNERMRISSSGNVGIGTTAPTALLQVGTATCNGTTWTNGSSREYKSNIRALEDPLSVLSKINVYRYRFRPGRGNDRRERIGVIAEELPDEVASPDHTGAPTGELIALSLAANRALVAELRAQQARIDRLEAALRALQRRK